MKYPVHTRKQNIVILFLGLATFIGLFVYNQNKTSVQNVSMNRLNHVQVFNISTVDTEVEKLIGKYQCVRFRTPKEESKICTYPPDKDIYVSGSLIRYGTWEQPFVDLTLNVISRHPEMILLDLGCNIGVFTISCAKLGRQVVAIDANRENLLLLSRSLKLNQLEDKVTLIWNAISNKYEDVVLQEVPKNVGGRFVKSIIKSDRNLAIRTVLLDDLSFLFKNGSVFIKMDIEGSEWKALNGSGQFFKTVNVMYVLMEFVGHRDSYSGKSICDFMTKFGFYPYYTNREKSVLNVLNYPQWPDYVLWCKVNP